MNDLSKPSTIFAGVNSLGLITTAVYFSRQNAALNGKINEVNEEIDTIKEGLKEKVPTIENSVKALDHAFRTLNQGLQSVNNNTHLIEKKTNKARGEVTEISDTLDALDTRFVNLVEALISKGIITKEDVDPPSKQVFRTRHTTAGGGSRRKDEDSGSGRRKDDRRRRRDETSDESESSDSEDDHRRRDTRRARSVPAPMPRRSNVGISNNDDDDIDVVARMASRK